MIVSHTKKFIYIKAAKVAGSSIESMLWESCGPEDVRTHMDLRGYDETFAGQNLADKKLRPHSEPAAIQRAFGEEIWAAYHKVTCIRNPWDTLVSLFWMRMGKDAAVRCRFEKWRGDGCPTPFQDFTDWVKADKGERPLYDNARFHFWSDGTLTADTYLRFEHLERDYLNLCHELDLNITKMRYFKQHFRQDGGTHYSYYYDTESIEMTSKNCHLEQRHFDYQFQGQPDSPVVLQG